MTELYSCRQSQSTHVVCEVNTCGYIGPMNMGARIAERLTELSMKQVDLLELVPTLDAKNLSALIKRDGKRSQWSEQIARALGVTHLWLTTGEGPKLPPSHEDDPGPHQVTLDGAVEHVAEFLGRLSIPNRRAAAGFLSGLAEAPGTWRRVAGLLQDLLDAQPPGGSSSSNGKGQAQ